MNAAGTIRRPADSPIDRAVFALGSALVAWSQRSARRSTRPAAGAAERELHQLRRAAAREAEVILARRDLGIR